MEFNKKTTAALLITFLFLSVTAYFYLSSHFESSDELGFEKEDHNIFFITVEALNPERIGYHGYERETTPNIDKLAEDSVIFENAYAPSGGTAFSFAKMFSSQYFHTDNLGEFIPHGQIEFQTNNSLVNILNKEGYTTVGIVPHFNLQEEQGFGKEFDIYRDDNPPGVENDSVRDWFFEENYYTFPEYEPLQKYYNSQRKTAEELTDEAIKEVDQTNLDDENLFMWLHYFEPHNPYMPPEKEYIDLFDTAKEEYKEKDIGVYRAYNTAYNLTKYDKTRLKNLYDAEIRYTDEKIGDLIDYLKESNRYSDSTIILTSDHGQCLGEHNIIGHGTLLDCSLKVPLLIKLPDNKYRRIQEPVSLVDLMPTVFDITNTTSEQETRGQSLFKNEEERRDYMFFEMSEDYYRIIGDDFDKFNINMWHEVEKFAKSVDSDYNTEKADEAIEIIREKKIEPLTELEDSNEFSEEEKERVERAQKELGYD